MRAGRKPLHVLDLKQVLLSESIPENGGVMDQPIYTEKNHSRGACLQQSPHHDWPNER